MCSLIFFRGKDRFCLFIACAAERKHPRQKYLLYTDRKKPSFAVSAAKDGGIQASGLSIRSRGMRQMMKASTATAAKDTAIIIRSKPVPRSGI